MKFKNKKIIVLFTVFMLLVVNIFAISASASDDLCDQGVHQFTNGTCIHCGWSCTHQTWEGNICRDCGSVYVENCTHENLSPDNICYGCGKYFAPEEDEDTDVDHCSHSSRKTVYSPVKSNTHVAEIRCASCDYLIEYGATVECKSENGSNTCVCGNKITGNASSGSGSSGSGTGLDFDLSMVVAVMFGLVFFIGVICVVLSFVNKRGRKHEK